MLLMMFSLEAIQVSLANMFMYAHPHIDPELHRLCHLTFRVLPGYDEQVLSILICFEKRYRLSAVLECY
jgi:hypothetical protein